MATDWAQAREWLESLLLGQSQAGGARWNFCAQFILNNLEAENRVAWRIFCCWTWMEKRSRVQAHGFRSRLALPERLDACVSGLSETAAKEDRACRAIEKNWPAWDFRIISGRTDRAPQRFSIGLLQKLAVLAGENPGQQTVLCGALGAKVVDRIRTTRSTITVVTPRDVDAVLDEIRQHRQPPPSPAPRPVSSLGREPSPLLAGTSPSPSVEAGRGQQLVVDFPSSPAFLGFPSPGDQTLSERAGVASPLLRPRSSPPPPPSPSPPSSPPRRKPGARKAKNLEATIRGWIGGRMRAAEDAASTGEEEAASKLEVLKEWTESQQEDWLADVLAGLPAPWRA